jgi:hypothetical protein
MLIVGSLRVGGAGSYAGLVSANELPLGDPIGQFVVNFAAGLVAADSTLPRAVGRSVSYKPGIGPFSESAAVKLVMAELACRWPGRYSDYGLGVAYPELSRQRCDVCLGPADEWTLAVGEVASAAW